MNQATKAFRGYKQNKTKQKPAKTSSESVISAEKPKDQDLM